MSHKGERGRRRLVGPPSVDLKRRGTIFLGGMVAASPRQGGAAWAVMQYVLGLRRLNHDVFFVEEVAPEALRPAGTPLASSDNARYFQGVMTRFGLEKSSALLLAGTRETAGLAHDAVVDVARNAGLLINIAGSLTDEAILDAIPTRLYLDLDPAFTQLWSAAEGIDMRFDVHTHFATVGIALGTPDCPIPTCGRDWITTLQPVVLDAWPVARATGCAALTTIANWRGYGSIEHDGVFYGQKAHSLRPLFPLPAMVDHPFVLALGIHPDERSDLDALGANGWHLVDPLEVAGTPDAYQQFVQRAWAEFGIAKSGYVRSHSGWFSDRSVCYLASGRPVIAQDTGFSRFLPTGEGLFAFETAGDVGAAVSEIDSDYERHRHAARDIAETYFDSDRVLTRLLRQVGVSG